MSSLVRDNEPLRYPNHIYLPTYMLCLHYATIIIIMLSNLKLLWLFLLLHLTRFDE